jgi:hypothetical protein
MSTSEERFAAKKLQGVGICPVCRGPVSDGLVLEGDVTCCMTECIDEFLRLCAPWNGGRYALNVVVGLRRLGAVDLVREVGADQPKVRAVWGGASSPERVVITKAELATMERGRVCIVCRQEIEPGCAVSDGGLIYHSEGECNEVMDEVRKDRSVSIAGRYRRWPDVLDLLGYTVVPSLDNG